VRLFNCYSSIGTVIDVIRDSYGCATILSVVACFRYTNATLSIPFGWLDRQKQTVLAVCVYIVRLDVKGSP
jgi:hypothetical protein